MNKRPDHAALFDLADDVVRRAGFIPDVPRDVREEIARIERADRAADTHGVTDMRDVLWCSIDNDDSRDLDQVQSAERLEGGSIRLLVGIADVDALVAKGSATDKYARQNATSVYTGVRTFPMLPDELSEGATSLLSGTDRYAVVT